MYKLNPEHQIFNVKSVCRLSDGACIPFDPANTDYQAFKQNLANGVALSDADGNAMTQDEIATFIGTLP